MNFITVVLLLQMAVSLLTSSLNASPAIQQQAIAFANQAVSIANEAVQAPATTTLRETVTTSTPPAFPAVATDTGTVSVTETTPAIVSAPAVPKTIQVVFSANSDEGFVTITNTTGVTVRIKNLNVASGTLAGITIGKTYGEGFVYSPSFTDSEGNRFDRFDCNGLGSLGMAVGYGGNVDPCVRKDSNAVINELALGETMVLRYTGSPTGVTYAQRSIVEAGDGSDVMF
jgi:hypothetical protein